MIEMAKNKLKTRCFFANIRFRYVLCDSNHKKTDEKSSTIASPLNNGLPILVNPLMYLYF